MDYYKIADLCIAAQGFEYEYFKMRMSEYKIPNHHSPDIIVNFKEEQHIGRPDGNYIATSAGFRQYFVDEKNQYKFFDLLKNPDIYSAAVTLNSDISRAETALFDIEDLGGANMGIRSHNMLGEIFRYFILKHDGIVVHSSCIDYNGQGIIFSAPSGTGKSTHTGLWKKYYKDEVTIINDDSPALRFNNGKPYVYGTPWSGKTEINKNISSPLKAVVILEQKKENKLQRISTDEAIFRLMQEVIRPVYREFLDLTLKYIEKIVTDIPVYILGCNMEKEAVEVSKQVLL